MNMLTNQNQTDDLKFYSTFEIILPKELHFPSNVRSRTILLKYHQRNNLFRFWVRIIDQFKKRHNLCVCLLVEENDTFLNNRNLSFYWISTAFHICSQVNSRSVYERLALTKIARPSLDKSLSSSMKYSLPLEAYYLSTDWILLSSFKPQPWKRTWNLLG